MELISIIVPVFNKQDELQITFESLISQSYKNIEILLIDDGSTDESASMCDRYANEYVNVNSIHKPNGGVSSARNAGLRESNGSFVGFVDAGDKIREDMYEILLTNIKKYDAKISECDVHETIDHSSFKKDLDDNNEIVLYNKEESLIYAMCSEKWNSTKSLNINLVKPTIKPFVHNKLYRIDAIKNTEFNENIALGEDLLFNLDVLKNGNPVVTTDAKLYNYIIESGSASHNVTIASLNQLCKKAEAYRQDLYDFNKDLNLIVLENYATTYMSVLIRALGCFDKNCIDAGSIKNRILNVFNEIRREQLYSDFDKKIKLFIFLSMHMENICRLVCRLFWNYKNKKLEKN